MARPVISGKIAQPVISGKMARPVISCASAAAHYRVISKYESALKIDLREVNYPTAPAGDRTLDPFRSRVRRSARRPPSAPHTRPDGLVEREKGGGGSA